MRQDVGVGYAQKIQNDVSPVCRSPIMVKPKVLPPPDLRAPASDLLPQFLHYAQVDVAVNTMTIRDKFTVDDTL